MSKEVYWTKLVLEEFVSEGCLSQREEQVLRLHVKQYSRIEISMALHLSVSCVDKTISALKKKYDIVSAYDPLLTPRKHTKTLAD